DTIEFQAPVELWLVGVRLFVAQGRGRRRIVFHVHPALPLRERTLNLQIAFENEALVMPPRRQRLSQREQMFGPPVALQAARDGVAAGFDAVVFERGQLLAVAFSGQ